jgi:hypothetical protein
MKTLHAVGDHTPPCLTPCFSSVYIALTDAKKAFDKVWHEGLYREMHKMNIYGDNWLL